MLVVRKGSVSFFLTLLLLQVIPVCGLASPGWQPSPQNVGIDAAPISAFAKGNGVCIAISADGRYYRSDDGLNWTTGQLPTQADLNDIAFNGTEFVIVGQRGAVFRGTDGHGWDPVDCPAVSDLSKVIYTGGNWVIGGFPTLILESPDLQTFATTLLGPFSLITGLAANDGDRVVALTEDGDAFYRASGNWFTAATSSPLGFIDLAWTDSRFIATNGTETLFFSDTGEVWGTAGLGAGIFAGAIAVNDAQVIISGGGPVLRSADGGLSFTTSSEDSYGFISLFSPGLSEYFGAVGERIFSGTDGLDWSPTVLESAFRTETVWAFGQWWALDTRGNIFSSTDGENWTPVSVNNWEVLADIFFNGTTLFACGAGGVLFFSTDGVTWDKRGIPGDPNLGALGWNGSEFLAAGPARFYRSFDGITWAEVNTPSAFAPRAMARDGANTLVIVGRNENILTSTDGGLTWSTVPTGSSRRFNDIIWTGSEFLAVGDSWVYQSADGLTWSADPRGGEWNSVIERGGDYVAVGEDAFVWRSTDAGGFWQARRLEAFEPLNEIAHNGSYFLAQGAKGNSWTSLDGVDWVADGPIALYARDIRDVTFHQGNYFASGFFVGLLVSTDGKNWDYLAVPELNFVLAIVSDGTRIAAVNSVGALYTSEDGFTWAPRDVGTSESVRSVAHDGSRFMAVGGDDNPFSAFSADGVSWTFENLALPSVLIEVVAANGRFLALDGAGDDHLNESGNVWVPIAGDIFADELAANATRFIAKNSGNQIFILDENDSWQEVGAPVNFNGIAASDSIAVTFSFVFEGTVVFRSTDGINFLESALVPNVFFNEIAYGNGIFLAVAASGMTYRSSDGINWTPQSVGTAENLADVFFDGTEFLVVGNGPRFHSSSDGITWTQTSTGVNYLPDSIARIGQTIVLSRTFGVVVSTDGGATWQTVDQEWILDIATADGRFYGASFLGGIFTSGDGLIWERIDIGVHGTRTIFADAERVIAAGFLNAAGTLTGPPDNPTKAVKILGTIDVNNTTNINGLARFQGSYYAVGEGGLIAVSADGLDWMTLSETPPANTSIEIGAGSTYLYAGDFASLHVTVDGSRWLRLPTNPYTGITGPVFAANGRLFTAGSAGLACLPDPRPILDWSQWIQPDGILCGLLTPDVRDYLRIQSGEELCVDCP